MFDPTTALNCFSNGWGAFSCILGGGFVGFAGGKLLASVLILGLTAFLTFRLKFSFIFTIITLSAVGMVLAIGLMGDWIVWLLLLVGLGMAGVGLYRMWKGRG